MDDPNNKNIDPKPFAASNTGLNSPERISPSDRIDAVAFQPSSTESSGLQISPARAILFLMLLLAALLLWFMFTSRSVQLSFSPQADHVSVQGPLAFQLGDVYLLRSDSYELIANAELHEPINTTIDVGDARNQEFRFTFTPLPGFVDFSLTPEDASVQVSNESGEVVFEGQADQVPFRAELPAGTLTWSVSHPRYQPAQGQIDVEGKQQTQRATIALDPNWADITIATNPTGASIWIDDEEQPQTTPAVVEALTGEREIRVSLEGHRDFRQRIFAQPQRPQDLGTIKLQQADALVNLSSVPSGAGVTINGRYRGTTPIQVDLDSSRSHSVRMILNGYESFEQRLNLSRGSTTRVAPTLQRLFGEVVFVADPPEARLTINGEDRGPANQTLRLPVTTYDIAIELPGYAGYTQTIAPRTGLTQEVRVKLLTVAEARLRALTPVVTTANGDTLRLFKPFDFKAGASRREPGRRANETLRDIKMDKLFYLSTKEVTNGQFRRFASGHDSGTFVENTLNEDDMPVTGVSWHEAAAYCNWLSNADKLAPYYNLESGKVVGTNPTAKGYRLPSEAEWAWAARTTGNEASPDAMNKRFAWGEQLPPPDRFENYADRSASSLVGRSIFGYNDNYITAAPVGTYKPNARGLYDLSGNVAEWIHDFYEIPEQTVQTNPMGPASGEYHVIRGASWKHGTITELRLSFRDYGIDGRDDVGFRVARNAE